MLRKLIKHELRGSGRLMLPMILASMVLAILAGFSTRGLDRLEDVPWFFEMAMMISVILFVLALVAICVMCVVLVIDRFRKNLLGDEGYLMFTLPVSVDQHLWSKMIVSAIWFALTWLTCAVAIVLVVLFNVDIQRIIPNMSDFVELMKELLGMVDSEALVHIAFYCIELLTLMILTCFVTCLNFYCALAIGYSFANRKMLLSVLAFVAITVVMGMLSSSVTGLLYYFEIDYAIGSLVNDQMVFHYALLYGIVQSFVHGLILYLPTRYLLKNKLNLP